MARNCLRKAVDLLLLEFLAIVLVSYCFRGATSSWDGAVHLSKIRIMLESLDQSGVFSRWNPYWYFGVPMWRIYSPLSYYLISSLGWVFHLSVLEIAMLWAYLTFSIAAVSTYLLSGQMGLNRLGRLTSSLLFLTSFNLITYWGIGSYPNMTGMALSPLAISLFVRALKTRTLPNVFAAGLALGIVVLTYFMHAIFVMFFIIALSISMMLRESSLLFISRGPHQPPKYTLAAPKILFYVIITAGFLSMGWILPFLTTYTSAPTIPGESGYDVPRSFLDQLKALTGIDMNTESPGVGHLVLGVFGCLIVFSKRRLRYVDAPICFVAAFVLCLSPWLRIPTGPLFWWRFTLYLSLFASICGGIVLDLVRDFCSKLLDQNSGEGSSRWSFSRSLALSIVFLVLAVSVYPVVSSARIIFPGLDILDKPEYVLFLERESNLGDRIAIEKDFDFNLHTTIPQSGGGNVHYVYMVNEFAYTFWHCIVHEKDPTCLRYFARSYNVRWLKGVEIDGAEEVYPRIYEVDGFNYSLAEVVKRETILALFIGDYREYSDFFRSTAMVNSEDIVPVFGGPTLEGFDPETLRNFDAIYLHGLRDKGEENLRHVSTLLSEYVEEGGGLILDTGDLSFGTPDNIPEPFPVTGTKIFEDSHVDIRATSHAIMVDVDPAKIYCSTPYTISYAVEGRNESAHILYEEDRPVVAFCERGHGRALWTGLRLPYLAVLGEEKEAARLLVNLVRFAASAESQTATDLWRNVKVTFPTLDEVSIEIRNASSQDAVWLKMSYDPGWTAFVEDADTVQLRIFQGGPNMMLVFPQKSGDFDLRFCFGKTPVVFIGEIISLLTVGVAVCILLISSLRRIWIVPSAWVKTEHKGSNIERRKGSGAAHNEAIASNSFLKRQFQS